MKTKILLVNVFSKGFTLIELLVVIAILGVLAAGVFIVVDPANKVAQANDVKVQSDVSGAGRAAARYVATHGGFFPSTLADLASAGEFKTTPVAPTGYAYTVTHLTVSPCTGGTTCTDIVITSPLKSKNYSATPFWRYESSTDKSCAVATAVTACP